MQFTTDEYIRYSRQIVLPEIGPLGQAKLKSARVLCIGAGGLGSPLLFYLAAAGIGTLGIIDSDALDLTNLQRQILHTMTGLGHNKAESAAAHLWALNPEIEFDIYPVRLDAQNASGLISRYDLVCDGSDNFPTRYLVNDACYFARIPLLSAGVLRFGGYLTAFSYTPGTPCYRCLYPAVPAPGTTATCSEAGVLGPAAGVLGSLLAVECCKWVLELGDRLVGRMVIYDALRAAFRETRLTPDPACPLCGPAPAITTLRAEADPGCAA